MQKSNTTESSLVEQYLHVLCHNKISENIFRDMLDYESKADPIEKKLIKVSIVISIIIIVFAFLVYKFLKGFIVL